MKRIPLFILALTLISVAKGQPLRDGEDDKSLRGQHHASSHRELLTISLDEDSESASTDTTSTVDVGGTGSRKINGGFDNLQLDLPLPGSEDSIDPPQLEKGGIDVGSLNVGGKDSEEDGSRKIEGGFDALTLDLPSSEDNGGQRTPLEPGSIRIGGEFTSNQRTPLEPGSIRIGGGFADIPLDESHDGGESFTNDGSGHRTPLEPGSVRIGGGFTSNQRTPLEPGSVRIGGGFADIPLDASHDGSANSIEEADDNEPIKLIDKEPLPSASADNSPAKKEETPVVAQAALRGISGGGMMPPGGAPGGFLKETSDEVSIRLHSTLKMQGAAVQPDPAAVTRFQEITGVYFNTLFQTTNDPVFAGNSAKFSMEDVSTSYNAASQEFLVDFVSHVYMKDNGKSTKAKKEDIQRLMSNHHVLETYLSGVKQQVGLFTDVNKVIIRVIRHVGGR